MSDEDEQESHGADWRGYGHVMSVVRVAPRAGGGRGA